MTKVHIFAVVVLILGAFLGWFVATSNTDESRFPFKLGLDLAGGTHLIYEADTSNVIDADVKGAMSALREVVERRTNLFGVSEPVVQTEETFSGDQRLVVELPGVTDLEEAVRVIGETPLLEFKLERIIPSDGPDSVASVVSYVDTGLTGRYVERAQLQFGQSHSGGLSNEPLVLLYFNSEGSKLFEELTRENVGEVLGIFLDGVPVSLPAIQQAISGGTATISGNFTPEEARELVRDLNFGALPLPITLLSSSSIGPTLGLETLNAGVFAGLVGFALVSIFMVVWYRIPGIVALIALSIYGAAMLSLFKFIPVTLTAAGIAALILSVGMAVDANILIFERMKEELKGGKSLKEAIQDGFKRAWPSIRDSNLSSLISAIVLFWFGTALIKGFALVFGLGVLVSMLSAVTISRTLLLAVAFDWPRSQVRFLFGSGVKLK